MTSRVEWHQDEWERDTLHPAIAAGLKQAAIVAQVGMRRGMGSEGGGVLRKATKKARAYVNKGGKSVEVRGARFLTRGGKRIVLDSYGRVVEGATVRYQDKTKAAQGPAPEGKIGPRIGTGRNVYYPAPPGAYPGVRTGTLRRALVWWRPRAKATGQKAPFYRIGVPAGLASNYASSISAYANWLDEGTKKMKARPWAQRTLDAEKASMSKAFARGAKAELRGTLP